jgi:hypothetical protein
MKGGRKGQIDILQHQVFSILIPTNTLHHLYSKIEKLIDHIKALIGNQLCCLNLWRFFVCLDGTLIFKSQVVAPTLTSSLSIPS